MSDPGIHWQKLLEISDSVIDGDFWYRPSSNEEYQMLCTDDIDQQTMIHQMLCYGTHGCEAMLIKFMRFNRLWNEQNDEYFAECYEALAAATESSIVSRRERMKEKFPPNFISELCNEAMARTAKVSKLQDSEVNDTTSKALEVAKMILGDPMIDHNSRISEFIGKTLATSIQKIKMVKDQELSINTWLDSIHDVVKACGQSIPVGEPNIQPSCILTDDFLKSLCIGFDVVGRFKLHKEDHVPTTHVDTVSLNPELLNDDSENFNSRLIDDCVKASPAYVLSKEDPIDLFNLSIE